MKRGEYFVVCVSKHLAGDEVFDQRPHDARRCFACQRVDDAAGAAVAEAGGDAVRRKRRGRMGE